MRSLLAAVGLVVWSGCGHAPPKPPAPAEKPVASPGDVAGTWVRDDDMGWFYKLTIDARGTLVQDVDRGQIGKCEQKGTLAAAQPKQFKLVLAKDTCTELGDPASGTLTVSSFTGDALVISVGTTQRAYHRDPNH